MFKFVPSQWQLVFVTFDSQSGGVSLISRHATVQNILSIFARHFLQSLNVEGSKGHIICGCAQDYGCLCNCFSLIFCLFETCSKENPSALSCIRPNATLFWECVFLDKSSSWGHCHDDVRSLGLLIQDTDDIGHGTGDS